MIQIICTLVLFLLILFPVGNYIYHVSAGKKTWVGYRRPCMLQA